MVDQIPVPQAKYELLTDVRYRRRKVQVLVLPITLIVVLVLFVNRVRVAISLYHSAEVSNFEKNDIEDAKVATWVRRARMYAESTKENENAEWNASLNPPHQSRANSSGKQIIVCYYTIPGDLNTLGELGPSHIDPDICTHIIVGFASVVNCSLSLGESEQVYREVFKLKNRQPKLRIMISAGGSNELNSGFSQMVENHANRKRFIKSVLNVTKSLEFDGLDLDWEFPGWMGADEVEKIRFSQLLQELRKEFDRSGRQLLLSVAVAAPQAIVDESYFIPDLARVVDFVNLMSYDYHFYVWYFPVTGLNAPLFPRSSESGYLSTLNVNFSAQYWISKGMPREKLVVGIPTYGHSYTLDNPSNHGLWAPANGYGAEGSMGFVSYGAVCKFLENGAGHVFDEESKVPYAFLDYEWISYDDLKSVKAKAEWIRANGFGGAMILSLNVDDWNKTCRFNETFPLTRTVERVLRSSDS